MTLPKHQRNRRSFAETFERDHEQTIAAMDAGGGDIPGQTPATPLALGQVGVKREAIPVQIVDPFGSGATVQLPCAVEAKVKLAAERRGIHVSRIGDLLARYSSEVHPSLEDYARRVSEGLRAGQGCEGAVVSVAGTLTYLEDVRGVKQKASLEHLELSARSEIESGLIRSESGVAFSHITACPCVQETLRHSFAKDPEAAAPFLTHTQRCRTRVTLAGLGQSTRLPALLACIDAVVVRSQNTLPREFELLNVHRAHAQPQFLEDALRDLMRAFYRLLRADSPEARIRIESVSMESIHDFDMEGKIAYAVRDLDQLLGHSDRKEVAPQIRNCAPGSNGSSKSRAKESGQAIVNEEIAPRTLHA